MFFGLLVSKKKYDEMCETADHNHNDLIETQEELARTKIALDRQFAVNAELRQFSEKFKEFYQEVTRTPTVIKQSGPAVTLSSSTFLSDRELSYGDVVSHIKSQMIYDLAKRLEAEGLVKFDLVDDLSTGRVAYKATLSVLKGV